MAETKALEEQIIKNYPYPIALRIQQLAGNPTQSYQREIWIKNTIQETLQYINLLTLKVNPQPPKTSNPLSFVDPFQWFEVLMMQMGEEPSHPFMKATFRFWENLKNETKIPSQEGQKNFQVMNSILQKAILPFSMDEAYSFLLQILEEAQPIFDFSLCFLNSSKEFPWEAIDYRGADPEKFPVLLIGSELGQILSSRQFFLSGSKGEILKDQVWDLSGASCPGKDLQPNRPEFMMYTYYLPQENRGYYQGIHRTSFVEGADPFSHCQENKTEEAYQQAQRKIFHLTQSYIAHKNVQSEYRSLAFYPLASVQADLNNAVQSKEYFSTLLLGETGLGKTNFFCHQAQEWLHKNTCQVLLVDAQSFLQDGLEAGWKKVFPEGFSLEDFTRKMEFPKERLLVLVDNLENCPHLDQFFLKELPEFLKAQKVQTFPLRFLFSCEKGAFQEAMGKHLPSFSGQEFFYLSSENSSSLLPEAIELRTLSSGEVEEVYQAYQYIPAYQPRTAFKDLSPSLRRTIQHPLFLRMLMEGCHGWEIPKNMNGYDTILNYLDDRIYERPATAQFFSEMVKETIAQKSAYPALKNGQMLEREIAPLEERGENFSSSLVFDFLVSKQLSSCDSSDNRDWPRYQVVVWYLCQSILKGEEESLRSFLEAHRPDKAQILTETVLLLERLIPSTSTKQSPSLEMSKTLLKSTTTERERVFLKLLASCQKSFSRHFIVTLADLVRENRDGFTAEQREKLFRRLIAIYQRYRLPEGMRLSLVEYEKISSEEGMDSYFLYHHWALYHFWSGSLKKAMEFSNQAKVFAQGQENPGLRLSKLMDYAQLEETLGNPGAALEIYESVFQQAEHLTGYEQLLRLLKKLGNVHEKLENSLEAIEHYDQVIEISEELGKPQEVLQAFQAKGRVYRHGNQLEESLTFYQKALELAQNIAGRGEMAKVWREIAASQKDSSEKEDVVAFYQRAYEIAQSAQDSHTSTKVFQDLGNYYDDLGESEGAIVSFEKAITLAEKAEADEELLACHSALAMVFDTEDMPDKARGHYHRALEVARTSGGKKDIAFQAKNLAIFLHQQGDKTEVNELFQNSYDLFSELDLTEEAQAVTSWIERTQNP